MMPALGDSVPPGEVAAPNDSSSTCPGTTGRRYPIGAEPTSAGVHFRVWAPRSNTVGVEFVDDHGMILSQAAMAPEGNGYFSGLVADAKIGSLYRFRLATGAFPDPASRFQPQGPPGPSEVIGPNFPWRDDRWRGRPASEIVLYELHLGTFTPEGTWRAAALQLEELARIGITAIEVMPVAEFPGAFGWGYDGVDPYAPSHLYGRPEEIRAFMDRAHALGLMVILDVVYNHLGPDGCYLREFSQDYFTNRYKCEWGEPLNFDGENSGPVREYFITNARYWVEEFHFDGLRLDATQQIFDRSPTHLLSDVTTAVRTAAAHRRTLVIGENETQDARLLRPRAAGGYGLDAVWNDDFHHSARVAATGRSEAYYTDYRGAPQEFISACKRGFLYQGQLSRWQEKRRGTPALDVPVTAFVVFLQNHDQVANSLRGRRLHQLTSPGLWRALTALQLLSVSIPLLFQGQEFAASTPFCYFADHHPELAPLVAQGRRHFLEQFRSIAAEDARDIVPPCGDPKTCLDCVLDFHERERHASAYRLHIDLLALRQGPPVFRTPDALDGAVLGPHAFVLRYFHAQHGDRLLIVNLGADSFLSPAPEPLLAPPLDSGWSIVWSSESPRYGGGGTPPLETRHNWILPGPAAYVLAPVPNRELPSAKTCETD